MRLKCVICYKQQADNELNHLVFLVLMSNWPIVSLSEIRDEMSQALGENQLEVLTLWSNHILFLHAHIELSSTPLSAAVKQRERALKSYLIFFSQSLMSKHKKESEEPTRLKPPERKKDPTSDRRSFLIKTARFKRPTETGFIWRQRERDRREMWTPTFPKENTPL